MWLRPATYSLLVNSITRLYSNCLKGLELLYVSVKNYATAIPQTDLTIDDSWAVTSVQLRIRIRHSLVPFWSIVYVHLTPRYELPRWNFLHRLYGSWITPNRSLKCKYTFRIEVSNLKAKKTTTLEVRYYSVQAHTFIAPLPFHRYIRWVRHQSKLLDVVNFSKPNLQPCTRKVLYSSKSEHETTPVTF